MFKKISSQVWSAWMILLLPLQGTIQTQSVCPASTCVYYFPQVARPPSVYVIRSAITFYANSPLPAPILYGEITNDSETLAQDVVLQISVIRGDQMKLEIYTPTLSEPELLTPNQIIPFQIQFSNLAYELNYTFSDVRVITWTAKTNTKKRNIVLKSVATGVLSTQKNVAVVTATIHNSNTESLQDIHLYVWAFGSFSAGGCGGANCLSRATVSMLAPGEVYTFTDQWRYPGLIPADAIHVVAQGVISP